MNVYVCIAQKPIALVELAQWGFWLGMVVLWTTPFTSGNFLVHAHRCSEVSTKNMLYPFIEGQMHCGMPRCAKIYLDLNEPR